MDEHEAGEILPVPPQWHCSYCGNKVDYYANPSLIGEAIINGIHAVSCANCCPTMVEDVEVANGK